VSGRHSIECPHQSSVAQRAGRESFAGVGFAANGVNAVGSLLFAVKAKPGSIVWTGLWDLRDSTGRMEQPEELWAVRNCGVRLEYSHPPAVVLGVRASSPPLARVFWMRFPSLSPAAAPRERSLQSRERAVCFKLAVARVIGW